MTIAENDRRKEYDGNGVTTAFTGPRAFSADHIQVYLIDDATGVSTLTTAYTLSNVGVRNRQTTVAMDAAPIVGKTLLILRTVPYKQDTDITNQGAYLPQVVEDMADALAQQIQQLDDRDERSLRLADELAIDGFTGELSELEALAPIVVNAARTGFEMGSTTLTGDMLLRPNLAAGTDGLFTQSGAGMAVRGFLGKLRDIVHADDRGLVGDGVTDETTALQNLFTAAQGKLLMLGYGKTYALAAATGLTIPANTTLIANGSKFKRLTARSGGLSDSEYNIIVGDDCRIDRLEVEAMGGASDIGGVIVAGNRVHIGAIKVTPGSAGSGSLGSLWNAVRIGPNSGKSYDVHIGDIECSNWDRPIFVRNVERFSIGFASVTNYCRGICFDNCGHGILRGGYIRTASTNATGTAGENGVLFDCSLAHGETHDIRVENVTVEDSGEHGFRIGGTFNARNIYHVHCHAKNTGTGAGSYPPGNNGGCGFKCLGATATLGARHQNIHYIGCSVEDINAAGIAAVAARAGKSNFAGFQMGKVFGGSIVNPIVIRRPADSGTYGETGNSCFNGIEIIGCQKITVTNPQIQRPYNSGIYIYDFTDGVNDWGQTDDIDIVGGHVQTPGVAGVEIDCSVITMRRISIQGAFSVAAGQYTMKVAKSGTGAFVNCWASMRSLGATVESFNGLGTDWTITAQGTEVGASACANGSTYQSATAGTLRVRKAGAWASL